MRKGFTLVELLATITILGLIALLVVPTVTGTLNSFREDAKENQKDSIVAAAKLWATDHRLELERGINQAGNYCVTVGELKNGYLEEELKDPDTEEEISESVGVQIIKNGKNYVYQYVDSCTSQSTTTPTTTSPTTTAPATTSPTSTTSIPTGTATIPPTT